MNPSKMLWASRKQPSAYAPACWRRGCRASGVGIKTFALATQPCCPSPPAPALPHQRCWAVLLFVGQCLFASPLYPASTSSCAHSFGPSRPRFRRPSFPSASGLSLPASGSLRSPRRVPVKASPPTLQRPPPEPTLRFAPGPLWFRDSKSGYRISGSANHNGITRSTHQPLIL